MTKVYLPAVAFHDNVGVHNREISLKNGSELTWGSYNITYTASDKAGKTATCVWSLTIVCKYLFAFKGMMGYILYRGSHLNWRQKVRSGCVGFAPTIRSWPSICGNNELVGYRLVDITTIRTRNPILQERDFLTNVYTKQSALNSRSPLLTIRLISRLFRNTLGVEIPE